jgi:CubicO group peptidase (beta-lactamase class C family)
MIKHLILLSCSILFFTQSFAQDKRLDGVDTFINRMLKQWHVAGAAVVVVEKNKVLLAKGFGYRNIEQKLPVTNETLFAIGSCTKAFTASLLGILAKDNLFELNKPVINYYPELRFINDQLSEQVTTLDMMSHRTGLPRHDFAWYGSSAPRDSLIYRIRFLENNAALREGWQYNNFMFLAQGGLIEKLTHKKWETVLQEKIFSPLGMSSASPYFSALQNGKNTAIGYGITKDTNITALPYRNIENMAPAGAINANANDMAKWVSTWIHGGKSNGKEIIPAAFVVQAISTQMAMGGGVPSNNAPDVFSTNYGLAWEMTAYRGHYLVHHGGNIDGFSTNTAFFPADSIGIIVLVNQNGSAVPSIIHNTIADKMLALPYRNWHQLNWLAMMNAKFANLQKKSTDSLNQQLNTKTSHPTKDYAGNFANPGYGEMAITNKNDSLFAVYNGQKFRLKHYHYDVFSALDIDENGEATPTNFKFQFGTSIKGNIDNISINFEPSVKDILFTKKAPIVALTKAQLQQFVGDYTLRTAIVKVYLRDENTLMVLVPGQPDYELVPVSSNEFNLKKISGYSLRFDKNQNGEIESASFIQPNGIFKALRIKPN